MPDDHTRFDPEGFDSKLPEPIRHIIEALSGLRYGVIQLTVHDGKPTQLDVTERHRFTA